MLSFFYFLFSQAPPPHQLNPSTSLLHPANTNTPSSHWKTSVFWGQGRGPTSNLPQSSHMKHLDCSQGEAGRKELGVCSRGGRRVFFWKGAGVRASGWLSLGLKKGLFECSVLSCTRQRSTHIIQRVTWANGQPSCTPLPPLSLSCNEKQKQGVPQILCLATHLPPPPKKTLAFLLTYSSQAPPVCSPHILPGMQRIEMCTDALSPLLLPHKNKMNVCTVWYSSLQKYHFFS